MGKAIGLETLKLQKENYAVKVKKQQPKPVSEEIQKFIEYGTTNVVILNFTILQII